MTTKSGEDLENLKSGETLYTSNANEENVSKLGEWVQFLKKKTALNFGTKFGNASYSSVLNWEKYDPEKISNFYKWKLISVAMRTYLLISEILILRIRKELEPDIKIRAKKVLFLLFILY